MEYDSLNDFQKVTQLESNRSTAYIYNGLKFYKQKNYEAAIQAFTKALDVCPNNVSALNNRGITYFAQFNFDKAIDDYTRALQKSIERDFDNQAKKTIYYNRAEAYTRLDKISEAVDDYRQVILLDPQFGKDKYYIVDKIKDLPDAIALSLLKECDNENTTLGAFIYKQMGRRKCCRSRGAAKKVHDEILNLNKKNQSSSYSLIGFFKQKLGIKDNKEEPGIELAAYFGK